MSDTIPVTVGLPTGVVAEAVAQAWRALWNDGRNSYDRGELRAHVYAQVVEYAKGIDLHPLIEKHVRQSLERIVRDEVGKAVQKMVRTQAREHLELLLAIASERMPLEDVAKGQS